MPALAPALRSNLEKTVVAARDLAEAAARVALHRLAVDEREAYPSLSEEQRALRVTLRARARQLGDPLDKAQPDPASIKTMPALVAECAYEQWHRLLFARFLAENNLLMHPEGVPVSLVECEELAADEGLPDGWAVATRYAARMLPQIFRPDDPLLQVGFAPESQQALEKILDTLPGEVFTADDSLGWVYQFWQTRRKEQVNASGEKIGAATISAVTQLFTEHYMVQFLLHNSLGAWWAARHPGDALPLAPGDADYLRRLDDGTPAAGSFPGWPNRAAELRILDPCGGSGHFMVAALDLMTRIRMGEEGLSERDAADAVLRDNLHLLEIDQRCTQIAAFALALAAWKRGGYRQLPQLHVACSGMRIGATKEEWLDLCEGEGRARKRLRWSMRQLYDAFQQAPELSSLIDPLKAMEAGWETATFAEIQPLLEEALREKEVQADPDRAAIGVVAQGLAKAAELLVQKYHLVITNVPYLALGKQDSPLRDFCTSRFVQAKADLATVFVERCRQLCLPKGTTALVTPQNWLFLRSYKMLRGTLLRNCSWDLLARLGASAFQTPMWDFNVMLIILTQGSPIEPHMMIGLDVSALPVPAEKSDLLRKVPLLMTNQLQQLANPDSIVVLETVASGTLLSDYVSVHYGSKPGQTSRVTRYFWEVNTLLAPMWCLMESTPDGVAEYYSGKAELCMTVQAITEAGIVEFGIRGREAWGRKGIITSKMSNLPSSLYCGELFDDNTYVL